MLQCKLQNTQTAVSNYMLEIILTIISMFKYNYNITVR